MERELRASLSREAALHQEVQRLIAKEPSAGQAQDGADSSMTQQMEAMHRQMDALKGRAVNAEQELQVGCTDTYSCKAFTSDSSCMQESCCLMQSSEPQSLFCASLAMQ